MVIKSNASGEWDGKMKVAFRADASLQIGSGHVMRCLTLAESLRLEGHECLFISREHKGHLGRLISQCGFGLHLLSSAPGVSGCSGRLDLEVYSEWLGVLQSLDARETVDVLATEGVGWLVVDHYALDAFWEQEIISAGVAKHILAIDDLANRKHISRLLLDQNLGREIDAYDSLVPENCTRLIGPSYALLREEFRNWRELSLKRRKAPELRRILISLGGVDKDNVTGLVLEALAHESSSLSHKLELDIVMGGAAPYLDQVRQQAIELPFRAEVNINVTNMAERMCKADLAIGAAGGTAWERCCLGLPTVLLILADNQASGARGLERCGAVSIIERCDEIARDLPKLLKKLSKPENLSEMAERSAGVTDGLGASRVVKCMSKISVESHA